MTLQTITPQWLDSFLAQPTRAQHLAALRAANLLNEAGLAQLVEAGSRQARRAPGQALQLAAIGLELAAAWASPTALPRWQYFKAQAHALLGEFDASRQLIEVARQGFQTAGQPIQALSTNIGLMHVLAEAGHYADAIAAGRQVLEAASDSEGAELKTLAARAQQNSGLCHRRLGQYELALEAYAAAESGYRELGLWELAGDISNNRGVLLLELGRAREALTALEAALSSRQATQQPYLQAQSLNNLANVQLLLGNYYRSLELFEQARQLLTAQESSLEQHIVRLDTAHAYLALNLYAEAETAFRAAAQALEMAGAVHHQALALWGLGATLLAHGQLRLAGEALAAALAHLPPANPLRATILLEQAAVKAAQGQLVEARQIADAALQLATHHGWTVPRVYALLRLADWQADDVAGAERYLAAARAEIESLGLPHLRYRWAQRLGHVWLRQGRLLAARPLLEAAIADIEQLRNTLPQESLRQSFLQDKMMAYDDLVRLLIAMGEWSSAFVAVERAKSRALADLMNGVVTAELGRSGDSADHMQQLQADLNALYNQLLNTDPDQPFVPQLSDSQAQISDLEGRLRQLQLRAIASGGLADPLTATPVTPPTPPEGVTLLAYYQIGDELLAFVNTAGAIHAFPNLAQVTVVQRLLRRLHAQWERLRMGDALLAEHMPALEQTTRTILNTLYTIIFAPLEPLLKQNAALVILPCGMLHRLPFHALFDGRHYLVERFEITYAPSATVLTACNQRPASRRDRALVMGVADERIPEVTAEVLAIAPWYAHAAVYLDSDATLERLQEGASGHGCIHLACHGLFRADNPLFSALKLGNGWLTAAQATQLKLDNSLIVLSGCETGVSPVLQGDEFLGLLRAFLGAGAATVVVSQWLVQDRTTAQLMSHFHRELRVAGLQPGAALRRAQLMVRASHSHPYYWAPFLVVGQR